MSEDNSEDQKTQDESNGQDTVTGLDSKIVEAEASKRVPVLTMISDSGTTTEAAVNKHQFYLGRSTDCDLQVSQPNASRFHAFITYDNMNSQTDDPVCLVEDNESRNGTYHNGKRLKKPQKLSHGDRILIGNSVISYLIRQDWELEANRRIVDVMNQYDQGNTIGRISCELDASIKILVPDETFTPYNLTGTIRDIDSGGIRLVSTDVSKELWLLFIKKKTYLKSEIHFESLDITINGRIAWSHFDSKSNPPSCIMGIEFTNTSKEKLEEFKQSLEKVGIQLPQESAEISEFS